MSGERGLHRRGFLTRGLAAGYPRVLCCSRFHRANLKEKCCEQAPNGKRSLRTSDRNGDIYVSDGYVNSRVVHFSATGQFIRIIGGVKG